MKYEMNIKDIRNEALQIGLKQGEQIGMDRGIAIGINKGIQKGIIIGMLQAGATYDAITKVTKASYDTIEEIAKEYHIQ